MKNKVLVTGGAGFIGSHLCDQLIERGYNVRILDNLDQQVHGKDRVRPSYLNADVELIVGDVRDSDTVAKALQGIDFVFHFAAKVGVGQSMYDIADYTSVNNYGTAVLLEGIIKNPVKKIVVASSMSIYGEGFYRKVTGEFVSGFERNISDLKKGKWELYDENSNILQPVPTSEEKIPFLSSVYALSKYDQERLCLMTGKAYNIPAVSLRFFNVYGTRQALSNPYTGVLAIFASRLLNDNAPMIFEDGNQKRDFINVKDIVKACILSCENKEADGQVFNIGSGHAYPIKEIADRLANVLGKPHLKARITSTYRAGDIRHCYADIGKAERVLGFTPSVDFDAGLRELTEWLKDQKASDGVEMASHELEKRGLIVR